MSSAAEPHVVEDCRGVLQVMSDGTVRRSAEPPPALFDMPEDDCGVEWKDVTWDRQHDLNARLYRPRPGGDARIPVVAYFHGGGFCIGSGRWPKFHAKEDWGKEVEYVEVAGADHGFFLADPWSERADELVRIVRRFVVDRMDSE